MKLLEGAIDTPLTFDDAFSRLGLVRCGFALMTRPKRNKDSAAKTSNSRLMPSLQENYWCLRQELTTRNGQNFQAACVVKFLLDEGDGWGQAFITTQVQKF